VSIDFVNGLFKWGEKVVFVFEGTLNGVLFVGVVGLFGVYSWDGECVGV
jgi:hypothetical protein